MPSNLSWIDYDSRAREQTLQIFSQFQQKESRDELGLGGIRDSIADQLFPGTSTIQTRLRYMFFIPWIYQSVEENSKNFHNYSKKTDKQERNLITQLSKANDNTGAIGIKNPRKLKRLPSSVYWSGLKRWGILLKPCSQEVYHRLMEETGKVKLNYSSRTLNVNATERGQQDKISNANKNWNPQLPSQPSSFPLKTNFSLTLKEAKFIQNQINETCGDSLLSHLAKNYYKHESKFPWGYPKYAKFSEHHKLLLNHARLFSEVMYGAMLLYNLLLVNECDGDIPEDIPNYEVEFQEWLNSLSIRKVKAWDIAEFWNLTTGHGYKISPKTKEFVRTWVELIKIKPQKLESSDYAYNLIKNREIKCKGENSSRFCNSEARKQWSGKSGYKRLDYRWYTVQCLLSDLSNGLKGKR